MMKRLIYLMSFLITTICLKSASTQKFVYKEFLFSLIKKRMLDKDPKKRININDVDKEIRKINFKRIYNGKNTKTLFIFKFKSIQ
jgi:hypothetical protein